jgi:hypothetical protein
MLRGYDPSRREPAPREVQRRVETDAHVIEPYRGSRHWAVYDRAGEIVCLTVYKHGAVEVVRRLEAKAE